MAQQTSVLEVENLTTRVGPRKKPLTVLDGVTFSVQQGEVLGIVGESGCGKSITALSIMGLIKPPATVTNGSVLFKGQNLIGLPKSKMRLIRGNKMSMIFQEPMTSLNPVYTIGNQIREVLKIHKTTSGHDTHKKVIDLLKMVGIPHPEQVARYYPHQLSGGMRQRAMIAMAMACDPELLIADEPTTALDVTIQRQILQTMRNLQRENGLSMILITHDLGVVSEMCDRVIVMYAGKIVEAGVTRELLDIPKHPYTIGLLNSLPERSQGKPRLSYIRGNVPPPALWGTGCRFADRCPLVHDRCRHSMPALASTSTDHQTRCWLFSDEGGETSGENVEYRGSTAT